MNNEIVQKRVNLMALKALMQQKQNLLNQVNDLRKKIKDVESLLSTEDLKMLAEKDEEHDRMTEEWK